MAKKIPTSVFSRGTKLMGLAGKLAFNEVTSRMKTWEDEKAKLQSKVEMAQNVVKTLSQLKGASMKLGQLISLDLGSYLPPEVTKVIETLHNQTTFLPYKKIEAILQSELGPKLADFKNITEKPIAAASIGQVHRASLNGRDVVLKVQYPGVAESIPSDMRLLEMIVKQISFFQGKNIDMSSFFSEVEEVLINEADYKHELKMHKLYAEKFAGSDYIVPEIFDDYSTSKVLTMEYIEGLTVTQWLALNPSEDIKERFADQFMKLYLKEFFHFGMVQTDPNPGNFLVTHDEKLALLDFGATKLYSVDFVEAYRRVLLAAYHNDEAAIITESERIGFLDARESDEVKLIYLEMMKMLVAPFQSGVAFDFADKSFLDRSRDLSWEMTRKCKYSPPPKDLLFLHRKLVGVFVFIKKLNAKVTLKDYWYFVDKNLDS
jgi:aarF domain-containing kinase